MRLRYLGDSYDIVKQSLLRWLSGLGPWAAHPMFTEPVTPADATAFSRLLGVPLISTAVLTGETNREAYFAPARAASGHLLLDPDTGLRLDPAGGAKAAAFLFSDELRDIVLARPGTLTLVFDQSHARGQAQESLEQKLRALEQRGVHGAAYHSHASFVLASDDAARIHLAVEVLRQESRLPANRIVMV